MKYNWHFYINPKRLSGSQATPWVWAYSEHRGSNYSTKITTISPEAIAKGHYKDGVTMHNLAAFKHDDLIQKRAKGYHHVITINDLDSFHGASPSDPMTEEGLWLTPLIISTLLQTVAQILMKRNVCLVDVLLEHIIKQYLSDSHTTDPDNRMTDLLHTLYHDHLKPHKANIRKCLSRFGESHYQFGDCRFEHPAHGSDQSPILIPIARNVDLSRLPRGLVCPVW